MSKTLIQRLCFSLFALALTGPRSCCIASSRAEAQAGPAATQPAEPIPSAESASAPEAAQTPSPSAPAESPELKQLRLLRADQAKTFQELTLVREERLMLIREDRAEYPITAPLIVMGVGFGMSAFSLAVSYLHGLSPNGRMDPELRATLIAMQVVGLPAGFGGLITVRYRLNQREHRPRIAELTREQNLLQRELNEKKRRTLDHWSVVPELSRNEMRFGLSVHHAF